jgi:NitT/TauT family transport system substrate-binding protein
MKLASIVCAVMVGATCPIAKAETATLRFGLIASSMHDFSETVFDVARDKGMFDRQSLAITFVPLGGVDHMITALDDDSVDLSSTATPYLVKGELRGSDAVAVVGGPANTIYHLVSSPDIASFAGLKGKTIGLSLPVDVISVGARKLLAKHGLASSDYDSKQLIGTTVRATCLKDAECAATPLTQPVDFQFEKAGYHFLGSSQEAIPPMQFTMIAARRSWADQHKDLVVRFARAMGEAYAYMHDPANRATVISIATKTTELPATSSKRSMISIIVRTAASCRNMQRSTCKALRI